MELVFTIIKMVIIAVVITLPLSVLLVRRWRHGSVMVPHSGIMFTAALLPVAYLMSVLFAVDKSTALLGFEFNVDSLVMILLGFLALVLTVLASVRKGTADKIKSVLVYFSGAVVIIFMLQILFNALAVESMSWVSLLLPIGSWLDISAIAGLLVIFLMVNNQDSDEKKGLSKHKYGIAAVVLMLILGVFANIKLVFILLALVAIVKLVQVLSNNKDSVKSVVKSCAVVLPGTVLVLSVFFIADNMLLNAKVSNTMQGWSNVSFVDVRPNWKGTLDVAKGTVSSADVTAKLFGPGSGSFSDQWRMYKPTRVNMTQFWSTNFNSAIGFIPTSIITGGVAVFAAWVLFLLVVFVSVIRNRNSLLGIPVVFMWIFAILNPVDILVLIMAFVLTGLFVAEMARSRSLRVVNYKLRGEETNKMIAFVVLPSLLVVSIGALAVIGHRSVVNAYMIQASNAMIEGNMNKTEQILNKVKGFADTAMVEQGYTNIALARLTTVLQEGNQEGAEVDQEALQSALSNVLSHARRAIELDTKDPVNYITLGNISEQLMSLGIEGAEDSALVAYGQASALDPYNPSIPLAIARVNGALDDKEQTLLALEASLQLKPNFEPALYQYGILKLSDGDTGTAIQALGSVVQINQNNANALYYLSLALLQEERIEEAIVVMQRVSVLNPENEDVKKILENLTQQLSPAEGLNQEVPNVDTAETLENTE